LFPIPIHIFFTPLTDIIANINEKIPYIKNLKVETIPIGLIKAAPNQRTAIFE